MDSIRHLRLTALLFVTLLFPLSALAGPSAQGHIQPAASRLPRTAIVGTSREGQIDAGLRGRAGRLGVVIELVDAPTALVFGQAQRGGAALQASQTAQMQLTRVERAQQRVLGPLSQLGATVIYRTQRVYNGIAARVDASKLEQIARLPGVKAIHPLVKHYPSLGTSVPLIGSPKLWNGTDLPFDLTGDGITVAVIDTGIDYLHAGFGGPGTQAAYDANDTTTIGESPALFPTARVVGGYDFVGDDYNGNNEPKPDPDPMDCNGHGSHVAGIAAGNGVLASGAAYTGPYDANTFQNNAFRIGPGVAPQADLIALRVFGCDGSTEVVNQALEWAVDPNGDGNFADRVSVINMSLGSDFGYESDATSVAADNAVEAGVIVVASAGNDGDSFFITGSPGTSPRVISVASSVDATDILDGFRENTPVITTWPAGFSVAYNWAASTPLTADLVYPPTQRSGCQAFSPANAALLAGKIALLDWTDGECGSVARGANLVAAGAVGAIIADNSAAFNLFITGSNVIPMVSTAKSVGDALKTKLAAGAVSISLDKAYLSSVPYTDPNLTDTMSSFSSRGPRRDGSVLKPDLSAPGQGIFSVSTGTGTQGTTISGTSMAAPHIAGSMALLRQLNPTWTAEELKALVMNYAVNNLRADLPASAALLAPARVGAGRADLPRAAAGTVLAYAQGTDGLVSVSFGSLEVISTATVTRTVQIENKGAAAATYNLAYVPATTIPGVSYTLSAPSVNVGAGQTASVNVTLSANASLMKHAIDPTISKTQPFGADALGRPWLSEASGYLALTKAALATPQFAAWIGGSQENPPTDSSVTATATFSYNPATRQISYAIDFTRPIVLTAAHFHGAAAGLNGPVVAPIATGDNAFGPGDPLNGSTTLSAAAEVALRKGELYVNFHTAAFPGGEVRGQVVPSLDDTALRLPIYANARPASNMRTTSAGRLDGATTLTLAGSGVNTGPDVPQDLISQVSAFELQHSSPNEATAASGPLVDEADLAYVGVASNVASTSTFTDTVLSFGIATHDDWSTPNQVEFDIYIDTNRDGEDDYVLFNSNGGLQAGNDQDDVMLTFLYNLATGDLSSQAYINGLAPSERDMVVYNTNVLMLPVYATDLGLTEANGRFNYHVETFSLDSPGSEPALGGAISGMVDETGTLTYDAANPGVDTNAGVNVPIYDDLPGRTIPLSYDLAAFAASRSQGVLLLHHLNARGNRVEVLLSQPVLNVVGSRTGKPGSYFSLEGQGFAPQETVRIAVDGRTVLTRTAGADGRVPFILYFAPNAPGRNYTVTAASVAQPTQSAQTTLTISSTAALLPRPDVGTRPLANALPTLYLPMVRR